jgi:hypothetical protein
MAQALEGDERAVPKHLGGPDGEFEGSAEHGSGEGPEAVGAQLKQGFLDGDEEKCVETLCDPDGELEGSVDGSDERPEESALLKLGMLEATKRAVPKH